MLDYFLHNIISSLHLEKMCFFRGETPSKFSVHMGHSMCDNRGQARDELHRLRITRAPHGRYSSDIDPCDFWIFADLQGKLKDRHLQGSEDMSEGIYEFWNNVILEALHTKCESWRDRSSWIIEHGGEHLTKWPICILALSLIGGNRGTFSRLYGHFLESIAPLCS